ncbi:hypothetical protein ACLOJK_000969 [Asimina triloba]
MDCMSNRPKSNYSHYSYSHEEAIACSFRRCSCFVLLFLFIIITLLGVVALVAVLALRPRKPIFALQALRVESLKINTSKGSDSSHVSAVLELLLNAENPNKVGLRYSPSKLLVLYEGVPVGAAYIPDFYQPAHSKNVSVQARVVLEHVSLGQIARGRLPNGGDQAVVRIVGDITTHVHAWHVTLAKIKVALDCEVKIDYRRIIFKAGSNALKGHKVTWSIIMKEDKSPPGRSITALHRPWSLQTLPDHLIKKRANQLAPLDQFNHDMDHQMGGSKPLIPRRKEKMESSSTMTELPRERTHFGLPIFSLRIADTIIQFKNILKISKKYKSLQNTIDFCPP